MIKAGFLTLIPILSFLHSAQACGDHYDAKRALPSVPLTPPTRPLEWGDFNVIHTTDTHGWLLGHQEPSFPEPNYSGDLGDLASFIEHMKKIADKKGVDLLLVDSGDLHDGAGLSDGFPPGDVDGHESDKFLLQLPYDVMTIGNHELYNYSVTYDMYKNFAPKLNGRYLTSNVDIEVDGKRVSVGSRWTKFNTAKNRTVVALGVLFNFNANDKGTFVQSVTDMIKESWFKDALKENPDVFLLTGHMPVQGQGSEWEAIRQEIRKNHPTTPVLIFGGHTHIRDCVQLDGRSMSLESGRYMDTIGWMSAKLDAKTSMKNITFTRRYLDNNRITYEYHTNTTEKSFDTTLGQNITTGMHAVAKAFDLDNSVGIAPHDFNYDLAPYPDAEDSLVRLFAREAMPYALTYNNTRASIPNFMIVNSELLRYDIFQGPFTKNDQLTTLPYVDAFAYIADVPAGAAQKVLTTINGARARRGLTARELEEALHIAGGVELIHRQWVRDMIVEGQPRKDNLTLGYVTTDSCPGVGDDTLHKQPDQIFTPPKYVSSKPPTVNDTAPIDLVFVDFPRIRREILQALKTIVGKDYTESVKSYTDVTSDKILGMYAKHAWQSQ